jgi:hypothetical protein
MLVLVTEMTTPFVNLRWYVPVSNFDSLERDCVVVMSLARVLWPGLLNTMLDPRTIIAAQTQLLGELTTESTSDSVR